MDISLLAGSAVELLKPYLGVLLTAGAGAVGKDIWAGVKDLWKKVEPKLEANPVLKTAAQEVAAHPDDSGKVAKLTEALRQLLESDAVLANEIQPLIIKLKAGRDIFIGNTISGNQSRIGSK
jgi:hypothetical protein